MNSKTVSLFFCVIFVSNAIFPMVQINDSPIFSLSGPSGPGGSGGLADSPWPMFRGDVGHTGLSPYNATDNPGKLKWIFKTDNHTQSSPAIGPDGTIYIGSNDKKLYAINPTSTEKWNFTTSGCIRSSPAIGSDGTIYVGSDDRWFYAINPNGTMKWSFRTSMGIFSSPVIGPNGTIYFGSFDRKLYALNPDGTLKWFFRTSNGISSSPAIDSDGTIYIGSLDNNLYAINPDGTKKWAFTTGNQVRSSPAIGPDGTIYIGSDDHRLYAINPDGSEKWNWEQKNLIDSSPGIDSHGTIYVGSYDGNLYAINPDGTKKWGFSTGDFIHQSSPAISADGMIFIGSGDHKVYAIYPNGTEKWNYETKYWVVSSPAIDSNGTVYIGSLDNLLYVLGKPPKSDDPVALAGINQTVSENDIVQFNGSNSFDPFGKIESYQWDFDSNVDSDGDGNFTNDVDAEGKTPSHIYGDDGDYDVTLKVTSIGKEGVIIEADQDVVFCADHSESMSPDAMYYIRYGLVVYVYQIEVPDQGCVVTFGDPAYQMNPLSNNYIQLKWDIASIPNPIGGKNMLDALDKSILELNTNNISGHEKVIVLISDGLIDNETQEEIRGIANLSASENIQIYTVGAEPNPDYGVLNEALLKDIADYTQGKYFHAVNHSDIRDILEEIAILVETQREKPRYGFDTMRVTVNNVDPSIELLPPLAVSTGITTTFAALVSDPGSDDITLIWDWGDGSSDTQSVYFNNGESSDPYPSPDINSINLTCIATHSYVHKGIYTISVTVIDDDNGSSHEQMTINVSETLEGYPIQFDESVLNHPNGTIESFKWDFDSNVDTDGDGNYTNDVDAEGPTPIHVYGDNGEYEVTLTVKSPGEEGEYEKIDQDVVFCVDVSGSMTVEAVNLMKEGLTGYVDEMITPDQGAVVVFGYPSDAPVRLLNPLTDNYTQLKNDIAMIPGPQGGTDIASALDLAINELNITSGHGNPNHRRVIILLTDGSNNAGPDPVRVQGDRAAAEGILIFTIGLEPQPGWEVDEPLLMEIANITGGKYYYAPDANYLKGIYEEIANIVVHPGRPPQITTTTKQVIVNNIDPSIDSISFPVVYRGYSAGFSTSVSDPGSDDITIVWDWGDGSSDTVTIYYNNESQPDPYPSPEINPVNLIDTVYHVYDNPGYYSLTVTAIDDDNGICQINRIIHVLEALIADFLWSPNPQNEGYPVYFTDESTYNLNDSISWLWDFGGLGSSTQQNPQFTFMDDGIYSVTLTVSKDNGLSDSCTYNITILDLAPNADFSWSPLPQIENEIIQFSDLSTSYPDEIVGWFWDFGDGTTSSMRNTSHIYGDDGVFMVKLTVFDDDNSKDSIVYNVTVINVDPLVSIESITMDVEIGLRVAGRKYNNVSMTLFEEGIQFGQVSIQRTPGSPDEQIAWIPKVLDMTKTYSAIVYYTPVDPPYLGANPVWIYVKFPNGSIQKIHHTFNVQQSEIRESEHWNHIDPWQVDLKENLIGWEFEVDYHVTDPGSDDEILTFSYGSQEVEVTHLCNPPNPDPYPSPEVNPMDIYGTAKLVYEGSGTIILNVEDDDNIRLGLGYGIYSVNIA